MPAEIFPFDRMISASSAVVVDFPELPVIETKVALLIRRLLEAFKYQKKFDNFTGSARRQDRVELRSRPDFENGFGADMVGIRLDFESVVAVCRIAQQTQPHGARLHCKISS